MLAAIAVAAAPAHADKPKSRPATTHVTETAPPPEPPLAPASITLPQGTTKLDATVESEMSNNVVAKPVSIAPDLAFGATDDLTLGIVTSKFATTGFRGSAGGGLCVGGNDYGCPHVLNAGGLEGWYALTTGGIATAAGAGAFATDFDKGYYAFKLGVKTKWTAGRFVGTLSPSVFVAATKRTDYFGMAINKDALYVPVTAGVKPTAAATIFVGSGVKGPLQGLATHWQVPFGVGATYAVGPEVTLGASWVFGALFSGADNPPPPKPPVDGPDLRVLQVWASYTR